MWATPTGNGRGSPFERGGLRLAADRLLGGCHVGSNHPVIGGGGPTITAAAGMARTVAITITAPPDPQGPAPALALLSPFCLIPMVIRTVHTWSAPLTHRSLDTGTRLNTVQSVSKRCRLRRRTVARRCQEGKTFPWMRIYEGALAWRRRLGSREPDAHRDKMIVHAKGPCHGRRPERETTTSHPPGCPGMILVHGVT